MHDVVDVMPVNGVVIYVTRCGLMIDDGRAETWPDVWSAFGMIDDEVDAWDRRVEPPQRQRLRWCGHCHARREPRIVTVPADPAFV